MQEGYEMQMQEQMWIATMKFGVEVKKAGFNLDKAFSMLRSARALLNECRLDQKSELLAVAEEMIVEAQGEMILAAEALGEEFVQKWSEIFGRISRGEEIFEFHTSKPSFRSDIPKNKKWIRLLLPKKLRDKLKKSAVQYNIELQQEGEHVILISDKESIRKILNEIRGLYK